MPEVTSMKLSAPKPTREMLPAIAPSNDGNEPFKSIPSNREVFQPLPPEGDLMANCIFHRTKNSSRLCLAPPVANLASKWPSSKSLCAKELPTVDFMRELA